MVPTTVTPRWSEAMQVDYSAYEGRKVKGLPEVVLQRGNVLVKDGMFHGKSGQGKFLPRSRIPA